MEEKLGQIRDIYDAFETDAADFKTDAACKKGCAYCCTDAGSIDITTLEGLAIRFEIERLQRSLETYLAGDHCPTEIMDFGKSHRIIINRRVRQAP